MLNSLTIFFVEVSVLAVIVGAYLYGVYLVRNRPDSPLGQTLSSLGLFNKYLRQGEEETEEHQVELREVASTEGARTRDQRRRSFRELHPPTDSMRVTSPDTGEEIVFRVTGTMKVADLIQRDDTNRDNPWYSDGTDCVFQILKGKINAWVFEGPGVLALVTQIQSVTDSTIDGFVAAARAFGQSDETAGNVTISWGNQRVYIYDIGRLGMSHVDGQTPWPAAPRDPGNSPWPDQYQLKYIFAGPEGGSSASHNSGDSFVCVIAPVAGNGGYVLSGNLIDERYLQPEES